LRQNHVLCAHVRPSSMATASFSAGSDQSTRKHSAQIGERFRNLGTAVVSKSSRPTCLTASGFSTSARWVCCVQASVVARCSIPRVAASGVALPLRYAWRRTRCIMQVLSADHSEARKSLPPAWHQGIESVFHRCDEEGLRRAYFRSADKPLNSGFKSTERVMFLGSRLVESDLRPWHRS
jgi:hypothetical protein